MTETIKVSESLELHAVVESRVTPLYQLVCKNRTWLQQSLNWPQFVQGEKGTRRTVQDNVMLHQRGYARVSMIFREGELIGIISSNHIESPNKTVEINYWFDESHQGQGIISQTLQALIHHCAQSGGSRRFVIERWVDNVQSNQVALRSDPILEDCLKQAESLSDAYDDASSYARTIDSQ